MHLTTQQRELYNFIVHYFKANHGMPTLREMMYALEYTSPAPVQHLLYMLADNGAIEYRTGGRKGAFKLTGYQVELIPEVKKKAA